MIEEALPFTAIIFDFAGTLCADRYFAPLEPAALDAIERLVFGANSTCWADPWMRGELSSRDIAAYLSEHLPHSAADIHDALEEGCSNLSFNPAVYDFACRVREAGRKTALVTLNMDVFSRIVVPAHGLAGQFDVVLNSADFGVLDKAPLWRRAFAAFGPGHDFQSSLLIDDSPRQLEQFAALGGRTCHYTGEEAFAAWIQAWEGEQAGDGSCVAE